MTTWRGHLITQRFGIKSSLYRLGFHAGLDLFYKLDEPQEAFASGIARYYPDRGDGYGNVGTVTLENGDVIFYAHLKKNGILVTTGTEVKNGQPTFVTGDTGYITGVHAHVEYRIGGDKNKPVDITKKLKGEDNVFDESELRGNVIRILKMNRRGTSEKQIQTAINIIKTKGSAEWLEGILSSPWWKEQTVKINRPAKTLEPGVYLVKE